MMNTLNLLLSDVFWNAWAVLKGSVALTCLVVLIIVIKRQKQSRKLSGVVWDIKRVGHG